MTPFIFTLAIGVIVLVLVLAFFFSPSQRFKRELSKYRRFALGDAPEQTPLRICGTASYLEGEAPISSPIGGRPCVAWRVVVERYRSRGKSGYWEKLVDESDSRSFLIEDGGEIAEIEGTYLDLLLDFDQKRSTRLFSGVPPELEQFCMERGIDTKNWLGFSANLRYREGIIEAGERVCVAGIGSWIQDPSRQGRGYRDVGRRFKIDALDDGRLLCTDHPSLTQ